MSEAAYDARGRVTYVTDPHGYSTSYIYDELDRMLSKTLEDDVIRDYKVFNLNKSPSIIQPPPGWAKEAIAIVEERWYEGLPISCKQ